MEIGHCFQHQCWYAFFACECTLQCNFDNFYMTCMPSRHLSMPCMNAMPWKNATVTLSLHQPLSFFQKKVDCSQLSTLYKCFIKALPCNTCRQLTHPSGSNCRMHFLPHHMHCDFQAVPEAAWHPANSLTSAAIKLVFVKINACKLQTLSSCRLLC